VIAKISKGKTFAGIGRYLYRVGKGHEAHVNPRVVAGDRVMRDDSRGWRPWVDDMVWCAEQLPDVVRPVWHCSLRAAPEDRLLTDAEWGRIAAEHIETMGLAGHPWVAVRHGDDHVHIVACRVDVQGQVWRDSHDYARATASARTIEQGHGLAAVVPKRANSRLAKTTASERQRTERLNRKHGRTEEPERVRLATRMRVALDNARAAGGGLAAWHRELDRVRVAYRPVTNPDGSRVIGYRVSLPDWTDADQQQVWLKTSQVDRRMSWPKLRTALGADTAGADRPPRTAAQLAAQAFPHATRTQPAPASSSGPARPVPPPQRDPRGREGPSR
jgi:hypothetical protein